MSRYLLSRFASPVSLVSAAAVLALTAACTTPPPANPSAPIAAPPPSVPSAPTAPPPPPPTAPTGPVGPQGVTVKLTQVSFERAPNPKAVVKDALGNPHEYSYTDPALACAVFLVSGIDGVSWEKPDGLAPEFLQLVVTSANAGKIVPNTAGGAGPSINRYDDSTQVLHMAGVIADRTVPDQAQARAMAQALAATNSLSSATTSSRLKWVEDQSAGTITLTLRLN